MKCLQFNIDQKITAFICKYKRMNKLMALHLPAHLLISRCIQAVFGCLCFLHLFEGNKLTSTQEGTEHRTSVFITATAFTNPSALLSPFSIHKVPTYKGYSLCIYGYAYVDRNIKLDMWFEIKE